ncbi:MAG: PEP-CTERM-box response regulator transcription factor [Acetobacteraceae bacterium]
MSLPKILIVEDDPGLAGQYRWAFPGFTVLGAQNRPGGLALVQKERPPVAVIDLGLPPDQDGVSEGFALLDGILKLAPETKVIVVTGNGERRNALRAVASGAYDFCEKPTDIELLRTIVDRALRLAQLEEENRALADANGATPIKRIVTASEAMLKVCRAVEKLAATNVPVLLLGESGTGKEALARALHDLGGRAKEPFVAINCGAIPENLLESELFGHERGAFTGAVRQTIGKVEAAHRGTLFLDEIADLPHPLQVKLLRVLQEQVLERIGGRQPIPVDVRIVSATNLSIEEDVAAGRFRADLFYRLNAVIVRIPPVRDRGGDALLLAHYFLNRFVREMGGGARAFSDAAAAAIAQHGWPGNVREIENRVRRAVVMSDQRLIEPADLELAAAAQSLDFDLRAARHRVEREMVQLALAHSRGVLSTAAKLLGISRPTLYTLLETHGLAATADAPPDGAAPPAPP